MSGRVLTKPNKALKMEQATMTLLASLREFFTTAVTPEVDPIEVALERLQRASGFDPVKNPEGLLPSIRDINSVSRANSVARDNARRADLRRAA
ncbi:MAG: hypothetical protein IAF58_16350 [Leptolyngbya sp.]|nr:hypothetical protein [Candidatus Melainabacteria bacterium]